MNDWYVKTAAGKYGPIGVVKLKQLAGSGKLKLTTKIASDSKTGGKWTTVSKVPALVKLVKKNEDADDVMVIDPKPTPPQIITQQPEPRPFDFDNPSPPQSQQPFQAVQVQPPKQTVVVNNQAKQSNVIGTIGFALSILSLLTCGVLAPAAALFSFIGIFFKPAGHAVAGLCISLGSILVLIVCWVLFLGALVTGGSYMVAEGGIAIEQAAVSIDVQRFYFDNMRLPTADEFDEILEERPGGAGRMKLTPISESNAKLIHHGMDGEFGTADDREMEFDAAGNIELPDDEVEIELPDDEGAAADKPAEDDGLGVE
jgi:hypothetical protein